MRLALLSDIHGNIIALDAVLTDIAQQGGVDGYWVLGDLVALGSDPVAVLERLSALPAVRYVRGNTDRYVVTGERPPPTPEMAATEPRLISQLVEVAQSFAWTQGAIAATGWFDWLSQLPLEQRLTLPDGTRLLGVHGSPRRDDEPIDPSTGDDDLAAIVAGCEADLLCCGHTHWPLDRVANGVRIVNAGSVSNPLAPDLRASYVLLDADVAGVRLQHRRVAYDLTAAIAAVERCHHPGGAFLVAYFRGERRPAWLAAGLSSGRPA